MNQVLLCLATRPACIGCIVLTAEFRQRLLQLSRLVVTILEVSSFGTVGRAARLCDLELWWTA